MDRNQAVDIVLARFDAEGESPSTYLAGDTSYDRVHAAVAVDALIAHDLLTLGCPAVPRDDALAAEVRAFCESPNPLDGRRGRKAKSLIRRLDEDRRAAWDAVGLGGRRTRPHVTLPHRH